MAISICIIYKYFSKLIWFTFYIISNRINPFNLYVLLNQIYKRSQNAWPLKSLETRVSGQMLTQAGSYNHLVSGQKRRHANWYISSTLRNDYISWFLQYITYILLVCVNSPINYKWLAVQVIADDHRHHYSLAVTNLWDGRSVCSMCNVLELTSHSYGSRNRKWY